MANSSNAYITKQPNSVNPSDWINKQQEIGNYYKDLERQKDKDELARKDKLRGEFNSDFDGEFDLSSMGNDVVNKVYTPLANQSLVDLKEAKDEGEKALSTYGINSKEYRNAKAKYDNIMQRPKIFKLLYEGASGKLNNYAKEVKEGKIHQTPDNIKKLEEITKTPIKFKKNDLGEMVVVQGENTYRLDEFADKLDLGKAIKKVDEGAIIGGVTDSIGEKVFDEISGYTTTTNTNPWDDYKNPSGGKMPGIKSILTKGFESALTDEVMESVLAGKGQFGYEDMKPEVKEELKAKTIEEWLEIGRGRMEEKFKTDFNSSKYSSDSSNSRSSKTEEKTSTTGLAAPTKQTYGVYNGNIDPSKVNSVSVSGGKSISSLNTEKGIPITDFVPHNVTRDKWGRMVAAGSYVESKSSKLEVDKKSRELASWEKYNNYEKEVERLTKKADDKNDPSSQAAKNKLAELKAKRERKKLELENVSETQGVKKVSRDIVIPKDREAEIANAVGMSLSELDSLINKATNSGSDLPDLNDLPDLP